jgi:tetratricopeptide (TPR) repeat protein
VSRFLVIPITVALLWIAIAEAPLTQGLASSLTTSQSRMGKDLRGTEQSETAIATFVSKAPLSEYPYLVKALAEERAGRIGESEALVHHAHRLNPRSAEARFWLAQNYLTTGRSTEAINAIASLYRLRPTLSPLLSTLLAETARQPEARAAIAERLANTPYILHVVAHAADANLTAGELVQLLSATDLSLLPDGLTSAQTNVTRGAIRDGNFEQAYAAWRDLLPNGDVPANPVYDGDFTRAGGPPFGWTLFSSEHIEVRKAEVGQPEQRSAIVIRAFGSLPAEVARQQILVRPDAYSFSFLVAAVENGSADPGFEWRIRCRDNQELAYFNVEAGGPAWARRSFPVTVTPDCSPIHAELRSRGVGDTPALAITGVQMDPRR